MYIYTTGLYESITTELVLRMRTFKHYVRQPGHCLYSRVLTFTVSRFLGHTSVTVTEQYYVDLLQDDCIIMSESIETAINNISEPNPNSEWRIAIWISMNSLVIIAVIVCTWCAVLMVNNSKWCTTRQIMPSRYIEISHLDDDCKWLWYRLIELYPGPDLLTQTKSNRHGFKGRGILSPENITDSQ